MKRLCGCGCGEPIETANKTGFKRYHKLCECGCGKPVGPSNKSGYRRYHNPHEKEIECACGCGVKLKELNSWGNKRRFINGHQSRVFQTRNEYLNHLSARKKEIKEKNKIEFPKEIIKECKSCGQIKPHLWNSTFYLGSKKPEYKSICKDCANEQNKLWQKKNRTRLSELRRQRKARRKEKYVDYLGGKCKKCGYAGPNRSMTFHHRDGADKFKNISQMLDWRWEKVKAELDKCDLLCFRCHMEVEDQLFSEKKEMKWSK